MNKKIVIVLVASGVLFLVVAAAVIGWLVVLVKRSPETYVVPGAQIAERHLREIDELGILAEGEEILLFYSDALIDLTEGMYLATDRRLVLYDDEWEQPLLSAPFDSIQDVQAEWDSSFLVDSRLSVTLANGEVWAFPVSSEGGGDRWFYGFLRHRAGLEPEPR